MSRNQKHPGSKDLSMPIIILVEPQMGENIGATARAMKNFNASELRIVTPRDLDFGQNNLAYI